MTPTTHLPTRVRRRVSTVLTPVFVAVLAIALLAAPLVQPAVAQSIPEDPAPPVLNGPLPTYAPAQPTEPLPALDAAQLETLAAENAAIPNAADQSWLEPRGVNIVDMVGFVPESHLQNATITYETGTGMLHYVSGSRAGNTVTVNVRVTPRYFTYDNMTFTQMNCLSQHAAHDQWLSTSPASNVRIYAGGREITSRIWQLSITPAGKTLPSHGSGEYLRYPKPAAQVVTARSPFPLPANNGCTIVIEGRHTNMTATFNATAPQQIQITPLGSQTFSASSYVGPGANGDLASLAGQMSGRFGRRHQKFNLDIPAGADYLIVNFPPTVFDPYAGTWLAINRGLAGSGSYRLEGSGLSVDHVNTMGLPIRGQWRDADQSGGTYLGYMANANKLAAPEYFLPPGFAFNQCMMDGGCPASLLDDLHRHTYPVTVHYYRFDRLPGSTLDRIALRQVGKQWSSGAAAGNELMIAADAPDAAYTDAANMDAAYTELASLPQAEVDAILQAGRRVYLPIVRNAPPPAPPPADNPAGCPCGWFDAQGRMFDFIPAP